MNNINKLIFILNNNNQFKNLTNSLVIKNQHQAFIFDEYLNKFDYIPFQVKNIGTLLNSQLKYLNQSKFSKFNK